MGAGVNSSCGTSVGKLVGGGDSVDGSFKGGSASWDGAGVSSFGSGCEVGSLVVSSVGSGGLGDGGEVSLLVGSSVDSIGLGEGGGASASVGGEGGGSSVSSDGLGVSRSGSLLGSLYQMYSPWCRYRFHLRFNCLRVPMVGMHRD